MYLTAAPHTVTTGVAQCLAQWHQPSDSDQRPSHNFTRRPLRILKNTSPMLRLAALKQRFVNSMQLLVMQVWA